MTQLTFTSLVGSYPATVCNIANGKIFPRPKLLGKIIDVTGGQVTANDLWNHYAEQREQLKSTQSDHR